MRNSLLKLAFFLGFFNSSLSYGAPVTATTNAIPPEVKVQKDHSFDDLLVQGKYHFADETVTTVEADRLLDALIGVRKDFKDRLEVSDKGY